MPEEAVRDSGAGAGNGVVAARARPLSPHLQIYACRSRRCCPITHRLTGVVARLRQRGWLVAWLVVLAGRQRDSLHRIQRLPARPIGLLLMLGWTWALFFHLANGIRHLFWDAGLGFELATTARSGWAVVIASVGFTLLAWVAGFAVLGARP
jgi:succinate dehydrogenase / fumarate reductase cytochrome b subunit